MKTKYIPPQTSAVTLATVEMIAVSGFDTTLSSKRPTGETGDATTTPSENQFSKSYTFDAFED